MGDIEADDVPEAVSRALCPAAIRAYDTTVLGLGEEEADTDHESVSTASRARVVESRSEYGVGSVHALFCDDEEVEEVRVVNNLSLNYFRDQLVEHFTIMFRQGEVKWPRRRGAAPRAYFETT